MPANNKMNVLSIAVLLALLLAAILPFGALADDVPPPPPDAPDVAEVPTEGPVVVELPTTAPFVAEVPTEAPVVEEVPTEPPVAGEEPTESAVAGAPTDPVVAEESLAAALILDAAPEGTELVVLDAAGEALPLASAEAAATLSSGDPMWCPSGEAPGGAGCSPSFTHFGTSGTGDTNSLIYWLENTGGTLSGTIYVASTYDSSLEAAGDIIFDYDRVALTSLVFQGGWDGNLDNLGTIAGTSEFNIGSSNYLMFLDWGGYGVPGDLTLNDIVIRDSGGLYIGDEFNTPTANVVLNNVTVSGNDTSTTQYCFPSDGCVGLGMGAAAIWTTGDVKVKDSHFDSNKSTFAQYAGAIAGLQIGTDGHVTLHNISASYNEGDGVDIYSYDGYNLGMTGSPASVLITNSVFTGNHSALGGWGTGVYLDDTGAATVACSGFTGNVIGLWGSGPGTLTSDSNTFSGNGTDTKVDGGTTLVEASSGCDSGGSGEEGRKKTTQTQAPTGALPIIAVTSPLAESALPGALPEGQTFGDAFTVKLMQGGTEVESAPGGVLVSIDVPAGMSPPITVFSWDGTKWAEVTSSIVGGKIQFSVTGPGTFLLVAG